MERNFLNNIWAVILCGGRGSRLGSITETTPKPLVKVHDKPILWYIMNNLISKGIKKFIFPLGYKGEMIEEFVCSNYDGNDFDIVCVETGVDTLINGRIEKILYILPENSDFFLINSDTIFDFNIDEMYQIHKSQKSLVTLATVEIISTWGLLLENNGDLKGFSRERKVHYLSSENESSTKGYIYSGISFINKEALEYINENDPRDFEENLYSKIIEMKKASHYKIKGLWYPIDTQKDLDILYMLTDEKNKRAQSVKKFKEELSSTK